ncbi:MAG: inositol monophosphatase family protein [Woeseia sp.]
MHALLNVAIMAARRGGDTLLRNMNKLDKMKIEQKGRNDFVSEADRAAERAVLSAIEKHYPDHAILAEESGQSGESEYVWVIDPLDGTTNYLHGFPVFCVSIAVLHNGKPEHAVVYDPLRQELFTASKGAGAQLDGRRIRVSKTTMLERALLGTGFPYRDSNLDLDAYLAMFKKALENTAGVRRPGSAALDLCYVAAGRIDGFWETGLKSWDIAAGALLIREAGGIISGLDGSDDYLDSGHVLAGAPKIYTALTRLFGDDIRVMFEKAAQAASG